MYRVLVQALILLESSIQIVKLRKKFAYLLMAVLPYVIFQVLQFSPECIQQDSHLICFHEFMRRHHQFPLDWHFVGYGLKPPCDDRLQVHWLTMSDSNE